MKMSPEELEPQPPTRERPTVARLARRVSWVGWRGAEVARVMIMEPSFGFLASSSSWERGEGEEAGSFLASSSRRR